MDVWCHSANRTANALQLRFCEVHSRKNFSSMYEQPVRLLTFGRWISGWTWHPYMRTRSKRLVLSLKSLISILIKFVCGKKPPTRLEKGPIGQQSSEFCIWNFCKLDSAYHTKCIARGKCRGASSQSGFSTRIQERTTTPAALMKVENEDLQCRRGPQNVRKPAWQL